MKIISYYIGICTSIKYNFNRFNYFKILDKTLFPNLKFLLKRYIFSAIKNVSEGKLIITCLDIFPMINIV